MNGFVLAFREKGPALVWYRRTKTGWDRYVIEKDFLPIEAGGAVCDIDGDGYPDLVFGGDWQSNKVWWWRNPGKDWKPDVPWERHTIKISGATQHHDQCIADFKGTGKPQLAYWNQQAKTLFCADIPANPRQVEQWPTETVFSGIASGTTPYAEGMSAFDIDGDGRPELLAFNRVFKYVSKGKWSATKIGDVGGLIFAGRFIKDAKYPQIVIAPGDGSGSGRVVRVQRRSAGLQELDRARPGRADDDPSALAPGGRHRRRRQPRHLRRGNGQVDRKQERARQPQGPGLHFLRRRERQLPQDGLCHRHGFPRGLRGGPQRRREARYPQQALQLGCARVDVWLNQGPARATKAVGTSASFKGPVGLQLYSLRDLLYALGFHTY